MKAQGIYKPRLILKAYKMQQEWSKQFDDDYPPQIMLFVIEEDEIKDTKLVDKKDFYSYVPNSNEYYLERIRDTEDVLTDYNLEPAQRLVDLWNDSVKWEDVNSLENKIDSTQKDMEQLKRQLQGCAKLTEELNKLIEQALEIGDKVTVAHSGAVPRKGTIIDIKGDVATVDFPAKDGTPARTDQYYTDELEKAEKLYGVDVFLDTVDGDPEPGLTEFNKESLIDYLNDFGYDLDMDCSDDELKEACNDLEQPIKYIKESLDEDPTFADLLAKVEKLSEDPLSALITISDYYDMTDITSNLRHIKVAYDKGYNTAQHQHRVRDLAKELFNELEKGIGQDKVKQLKSNIVGI